MSKRPLAKRERSRDELTQAVHQFITTYIAGHGYSPNMREIGEACHIGRTTAVRYLDRLEMLGHIRRDLGVARGITLLHPPS